MTPVKTFGVGFASQKFVVQAVAKLVDSLDLEPDERSLPGGTLSFPEEGGERTVAVEIPHLPGMDALEVRRARLQVSGRRVDLPSVVVQGPGDPAASITGPSAGLVARIRLAGLQLDALPGDATEADLPATAGATGHLGWTRDEEDGTLHRSTGSGSGGGEKLHLLVRAGPQGGPLGPPAAAAPSFAMPAKQAGLYGPVLAGAKLTVDDPANGGLVLQLTPPLPGRSVEVLLVTAGKDGDHEGLPTDASSVDWHATRAEGVWTVAPTAVKLTATGASGPGTLLSDIPGEMPTDAMELDATAALGGVLASQYDPTAVGAPVRAEVRAISTTAGDLVIGALAVAARYRFEAAGPDGVPVSLRGAAESASLALPGPFPPARLRLTLDGSFGPGLLLESSDRPGGTLRRGVRVAGPAWAARRLTVARDELNLPLMRVSLLGRATEPTEVVVGLHRGDERTVGPRLGTPVSLVVDPALEPAWHRADLPDDPALLPNPAAVWVVVQATRGVFWWYGQPGSEGPTLLSPDAGGTWGDHASRPFVQLHLRTPVPEPAPLAARWSSGLLAADVLALEAARTRLELSGRQVATAGLVGEASPAAPGGASAAFRLEGIEPFPPVALEGLASAGPRLDLTFSCDRDVDFRVLDAVLTYDPWSGGT